MKAALDPRTTRPNVDSADTLFDELYSELHRLARRELRRQGSIAGLGATTLLHEAYLSISGRAEVVKDKAKIEELWSPVLKAWFPEGLDDPHLCLLKIPVEQAEYWDAPSSKIVQLFGMAKAIATGQEADYGENKKITL